MAIFLILGLIDKFVLIIWILSSTQIECLTLNLNENIVVDHLFVLVQGMARNMMACLVGMDDCFNCRKSGHKMKDSLLLAT